MTSFIKKTLIAASTLTAGLVATGAQAGLSAINHGSNCHVITTAQGQGVQGDVGVGEPGIGNWGPNTARVFCSAPASAENYAVGNSHAGSMYVSFLDGSSTVPFSCYPYAVGWLNAEYWGPRQYTCSTGGCADSTSSFTGQQTMGWSSPFGSTRLYLASYGVSCTIAPNSWVVSTYQYQD